MAEIRLGPGEVFEHEHAESSTTTLATGAVVLVMDGVRQALEPGVDVPVPARVSHSMVNIGGEAAVVFCKYGAPKPPA